MYLTTPMSMLLMRLTALHVKTFGTFNGITSFIAVFTKAHYGILSRNKIQPGHTLMPQFFKFIPNHTAEKFHTVSTYQYICGNKMPTRCNRGFYCRSYCFLNMFQAPLCPSSGAQEYYTVVAGLQDAAASCKPDT